MLAGSCERQALVLLVDPYWFLVSAVLKEASSQTCPKLSRIDFVNCCNRERMRVDSNWISRCLTEGCVASLIPSLVRIIDWYLFQATEVIGCRRLFDGCNVHG